MTLPNHPKLRFATPRDAEALLAIYAPFITDSPISFEYVVPKIEEFSHRIEKYQAYAPWLVCCAGDTILGYAYASQHRTREAYNWTAEVSVYLAPQAQRQGIGPKLYEHLFELLRELGYCSALAGISLPNEASVKHHEKMGFEWVGIYRNIGYKQGKWHDVGWLQKALQPYSKNPAPPRRTAELSQESKDKYNVH